MTIPVTAAAAPIPLPATSRCEYPIVGVVAVLVGAFISTLNVRITTQGLADIRGALSLGFDEGSWVSTIFSAAQMVVTPAAAWMSTVLGTRRVLLWTGAIFTAASLLPPFVQDYDTLIALQFVRGLAVGAFIPAAPGFILRSLAPHGGCGASQPIPSTLSFRGTSAARSRGGIRRPGTGNGSSGRTRR
jgi:DHA2 family multidrug resistance protein